MIKSKTVKGPKVGLPFLSILTHESIYFKKKIRKKKITINIRNIKDVVLTYSTYALNSQVNDFRILVRRYCYSTEGDLRYLRHTNETKTKT